MACAGHAHIEEKWRWGGFTVDAQPALPAQKPQATASKNPKPLQRRAQERQAPSERRSFERNVRTRIQAVASERSSRALLLKINALKLFTLPELRLSF